MIRRPPRSTRTDTLFPYTTLFRSSPPPPTVEVSVTGLRSEQGQVLVCLTPNRKAFPDCSKDADSVRMAVKAADAGHFAVHAPAAGTYAIAVVHDGNSNNKMDKAIFVPTEGFGFSRNPTRSEERRVGKEWVSTCRYRGST